MRPFIRLSIVLGALFLLFPLAAEAEDRGLDNQWTVEIRPGGFFFIRNRVSNLCLGVRGVDRHNASTDAEVYHCDPGGNDQGYDNQWVIVPLRDGFVHIKNRVSNLCLGVRGVDKHVPKAGVEVYHCNPGGNDRGHDNQWTVHLVDGYVHFKNRVSNLCLGVRGVDRHRASTGTDVFYCRP